jgi:hypothetical protein
MATSTALLTSLNLEQRKSFLSYAKNFADSCTELGTFRALLEYRDRAYQLQMDQTAERIQEIQRSLRSPSSARRKLADLEVPIALPQVESAVAYQTGVYLTSYPIFGVIATPKNQNAALQFETVIGNHSIRYGWAQELIKAFRNGFKYNFGPVACLWRKQNVASITTSTETTTAGLAALQGMMQQGNVIRTIDPYNCFMDMTVQPSRHHEDGTAFGWNELHNRMQFKRFVATLDPTKTTSLREAFESSFEGGVADASSATNYYIPTINRAYNVSSMVTGTNWLQYAGLQTAQNGASGRINYKDRYLVTHFICRALPSDFGRQGNTPAIFYGIIANWRHVIYVEQLISPNDHLPVFIMQPNDDGLGYQTQSMLDTALPFQDMSSALWNITLESQRRQVFDRLIYNERYINKSDIDPASSVARIPLRNASQFKGEDIGKAIYQIPYRNDNAGFNLQLSEMVGQMADVASGQNKVDRGQFQKGNKTKTEFETTMVNSNARQQLVSICIENQFMTPLKETIKNNLLLNQEAGTFMNRDQRSEVEVDPVALRSALLEFKLTDGVLPADKLLNMELMTVFLQTAQAMPTVMTEYDIMGMFLYWAKLKGAYWLEDFKRNPQQQQQFLSTLQQTSMAQNATPPEQQIPGV